MESKYFESLYPVEARDQELEKIVGYIREGVSSQVVGLPGVGRSTILGLLAYNREIRLRHFPKYHGSIHFVMVNFSEVKTRPYPEVVKFLFLCLSNSLREREMPEEYEQVDTLFKEALNYNDELVISQGLKNAIEYLAVERKLTLVLLFDRFDEYIPQVSMEFFTLLRSLRDRAKYRFSVVFSLDRPLEETVEPSLVADFSDFISGHVIYLPLLDEPSSSFRLSYLEKLTAKTLSVEQKKEVLRLTAGHIRLLKVAAEAMLAEGTIPADIEAFLLSQKTVHGALMSIWKSLTPGDQVDLSKGEIHDHQGESYLQKVGLLEGDRITIPLFAKALADKLFQENEAKIVYDEAANIIKKGDLVLSDSLTKAEFRLLRYLLQHPQEIVDRETVISEVWQEAKTTLGVTEQAVDQLIFRLRHKIEEDPNNSRHLLTIKGRGIKFMP